MNRRSFLTGLAALVGGVALEEAIPFGRIWSFPKDIKPEPKILSLEEFSEKYIRPTIAEIANKVDQDGLSTRYVRSYDLATDRSLIRMDVLHSWGNCYPESACRLAT